MRALEEGVSTGVNGPIPISELVWFTSQLIKPESTISSLLSLGGNQY
jgi:hypothetical protein